MIYRTICSQLWTDPEIKRLNVSTKLLFLYFITNPHTHLSGIYYLPVTTILQETGMKPIPYRYGIDTLSKLEKAFYDPQTETVFVLNMFQYQGQGPKNEASATKHLETLHHSCLIAKFVSRYPQIPYRYPIQNTPSVPDPVLLTTSPNPDPNLQSKTHPKKSNGLRPISDDDKPTEKNVAFGRSLQIEVGPEWGKFKNYCLAHGKRYANFEAAFRNWLAKSLEMKGLRA